MTMARVILDLLAEPLDDLYYGLLGFALTDCTTALLVQHTLELSETGQRVMRRLERFLREVTVTDEWPGTKIFGGTATVLRYNYVHGCAEILKQATNRLYGWTQGVLPEDLCLLRDDGDPWLVTITHEHEGYLRLSHEERGRLVEVLPRMGPMLRDEHCRGETREVLLEVQRLLDATDPEGWVHYQDPEGGSGPEAQAIYYALASGEARAEAELARYIMAMLERWWGRYASVTYGACADLARVVWAWWRKRQGPRGQG
jgi:hypothetical protein